MSYTIEPLPDGWNLIQCWKGFHCVGEALILRGDPVDERHVVVLWRENFCVFSSIPIDA
jgi:hypothetical protein